MTKKDEIDTSTIQDWPVNDKKLRVFLSASGVIYGIYRLRVPNDIPGAKCSTKEQKEYVGRVHENRFYPMELFDKLFTRTGKPRLAPNPPRPRGRPRKTDQGKRILFRAKPEETQTTPVTPATVTPCSPGAEEERSVHPEPSIQNRMDTEAGTVQSTVASDLQEPTVNEQNPLKNNESQNSDLAPLFNPVADGEKQDQYVGVGALVWHTALRIGMLDDLHKSFMNPTLVDMIMSAVMFMIESRSFVASRFDEWSSKTYCPSGPTSSQELGEALDLVGSVYKPRMSEYFKLRAARCPFGELTSYDSTNMESSSGQIREARSGLGKGNVIRKQLNLAFHYQTSNRSVIGMDVYDGNINDMANFKELLIRLHANREAGMKILTVIVDRGYFSTSNVEAATAEGGKFLFCVVNKARWVREIRESALKKIDQARYVLRSNGAVHGISEAYDLKNGKKIWLHVYVDNERRAAETAKLNNALSEIEKKIEDNEELSLKELKLKKKFLHNSKVGGKRQLTRNWSAIESQHRDFGVFMNLTTWECSADEAYKAYDTRSDIEKCFELGKSRLGMDSVRSHTIENVWGRAFVTALAVTILGMWRLLISTSYAQLNFEVQKAAGKVKAGEKRARSLEEEGINVEDLIEIQSSLKAEPCGGGKYRYLTHQSRLERFAAVLQVPEAMTEPPVYCDPKFHDNAPVRTLESLRTQSK